MEDIFKLRPEMLKSADKDAAPEDEMLLEKKKKKKKKKKYVKYEYDDELGEVVAHKRRKGDADWEEDW